MRINRGLVLALGIVLLSGCAIPGSSSKATSAAQSSQSAPAISPSASSSPSVSPELAIVQSTTAAFFDEYLSCMKSPPSQAKGNVGSWCQSNNSHGAKDLAKHLKTGGVAQAGADPIVCSQSFPKSYTVKADRYLELALTGQATVTEKFASGDVFVNVQLNNATGNMLVNNIICPAPSN